MTESIDQLIALARDSSPVDRVEQFRDRLADLGSDVVPAMVGLRDDSTLCRFAVTVLEVLSRKMMASAWEGLALVSNQAVDVQVRDLATEALNRVPVSAAEMRRRAAVERAERAVVLVESINTARQRRGDRVLDENQAREVLHNLELRAQDPNRYHRWCWSCRAVVDAATNENCPSCGWLVCWCGACRDPKWRDRNTKEVAGPCPRYISDFERR